MNFHSKGVPSLRTEECDCSREYASPAGTQMPGSQEYEFDETDKNDIVYSEDLNHG